MADVTIETEDMATGFPVLVIRSPDGTRWKITIDNSGVIQTTAL